MIEYKDTLNLPQTPFPMKADLAKREPEILKKWQDLDLYTTLRKYCKGRKKFVLHAGPPYANGHIHLGTATTSILKDIIVKAKTIAGFDAPYVPGWDCHGLPIELNVEKKIGKPGRKVDAEQFRAACRQYAEGFIDIQRKEFMRLGIIADWQHPYLTMDPRYEADIMRSLAIIIANGHLQKGLKPVHWCLDCASALAEAEVEYMDKVSHSIDVRFIAVDNADLLNRFGLRKKFIGSMTVPIWTTTPWTLPANQAVALNPEVEYVLISSSNEKFIIAEPLIQTVLTRYGIKTYEIESKTLGKSLAGATLKHPFYAKEVPIVLGEHVTIDAGTGAVHTAPAHGQDDYLIGLQYDLPLEVPIGRNGCYLEKTPLFAGLHVRKVDETIIAELKKHKALIHQEKISHSYPHCWRHKSALIFLATPQWFINMEKKQLREEALDAIDHVDWIPEWGENRIKTMITNRPDWCISRQRTWGVPLGLFVHKETGELHPDMVTILEKIAQIVDQQGIEGWYTLDPKALLGAEAAKNYDKINDVLDVWFDSGVSHQCVLKKRLELHFPADIVLEGSDQHRGWFQSSLLTSIAMNHSASYKAVLTHGFVVDAHGRKMSKSLGNVIAPEEVISSLGADILRLWVASVDYRNEITASKEILTRMSEAYRRIRNTARFLLANLNGFDPDKDLIENKNLLAIDQYAIDKTLRVQNEIMQAFDTYQFHLVTQKLHHFCLIDMGGFYLDIIKDRQYTMQENSLGRRSAQTALYHIVHAMVRWMAPILSFTAEEIWQYLPSNKIASVFFATSYQDLFVLSDKASMNSTYWEKIRTVRDAVNKEIENKRNVGEVGSSLEASVTLYCLPDLKAQLDLLGDELRFLLITSEAHVLEYQDSPNDVIKTDIPELKIKVVAIKNQKCVRCWHRTADVNSHPEYPGLCHRCVINVSGSGETRQYV